MSKDNFYGKCERMMRHYDSLKNFIGNNEVFPGGDVLYVSTNNNGSFDMILFADGKSTFMELYSNKKKEEQGSLTEDNQSTADEEAPLGSDTAEAGTSSQSQATDAGSTAPVTPSETNVKDE